MKKSYMYVFFGIILIMLVIITVLAYQLSLKSKPIVVTYSLDSLYFYPDSHYYINGYKLDSTRKNLDSIYQSTKSPGNIPYFAISNRTDELASDRYSNEERPKIQRKKYLRDMPIKIKVGKVEDTLEGFWVEMQDIQDIYTDFEKMKWPMTEVFFFFTTDSTRNDQLTVGFGGVKTNNKKNDSLVIKKVSGKMHLWDYCDPCPPRCPENLRDVYQ